MDNLWGDFDISKDQRTPKDILQEQGRLLKEFTKGIIYASVYSTVDENTVTKFDFDFIIRSAYYDKYRFRLLSVSHDYHLYPVSVFLNENVENELKIEKQPKKISTPSKVCTNEQEFLELLSQVLKTSEVKSVVSSLYKLSR